MYVLLLHDTDGAGNSARFRSFVRGEDDAVSVPFTPGLEGDTVRRVSDRGEYLRIRVDAALFVEETDDYVTLTMRLP